MKKEPFYNLILRVLRCLNISHFTIGKKIITVTSGYLAGLSFIPYKNRVKIHSISRLKFGLNGHLDLLVNYSVQAFFYQLYRYGFLNQQNYSVYVKNYGKAN